METGDERPQPHVSNRLGKRTKVANEPLNGSTIERKSRIIIDKQNYSMKTEALSTLNFSAACQEISRQPNSRSETR